MLWSRWQCWQTDDNVMNTMTKLWNRWQCYEAGDYLFCEIDDNVRSMTSTSSFHHNPPLPPPHFNHTTNRWQRYETDDNVGKPMTMLWKRWQCYETDDNALKPKITYREVQTNVSMPHPTSFSESKCKRTSICPIPPQPNPPTFHVASTSKIAVVTRSVLHP